MLDYVPAQFRVRVTCRPRYGCRACEEAVVQAPAPERPIDGGMATEALLAHVLVSKYSDHLPLYRQAQIFARQGITLDRSTLCNWVGRACWWLAPLHELVLSTVLSSPKVFADDTTLPVLDPGRGRPRPGGCGATRWTTGRGVGRVIRQRLMFIARIAEASIRKRIWRVPRPAAGRWLCRVRRAGPRNTADAPQLAFCWAHARRKFYDIHVANQSPLAAEALRRIAELYDIEAGIRGTPADNRRSQRQQRSRPLVEAMHAWLDERLERIPAAPPGTGNALCPEPLERADTVSRRWPAGDGHQHRRACHAPGRSQAEKCIICRRR